jgi:16S rRNA (cytosine967-C5)-methyltransferase
MPIPWKELSLNEVRRAVRPAVRKGGARHPSPRSAAALAVKDVLGTGRALDQALEQRQQGLNDPRDKALTQEMAFGVLRWLPRLRAGAAQLLSQPMKQRDLDVESLLLVGLYQLWYLRVPTHAAVSETVAAAAPLHKPWAAGLLNAVLRNFQRRRQAVTDAAEADPDSQLCFPAWLLERLRLSWPADWQELAEASNQRPPMTLRVNRARISRSDYAARLAAAGLAARPLAFGPAGLILDRPEGVTRLPGFDEGLVSVQDGAAQLAAPLLGPEHGEEILDACAAPGGKTCHLLELAPAARVTAVDVNETRLRSLRAGLGRLGLRARVLAADLAQTSGAWADRRYRRILLDVPCSATGVIRRHPDIKWLRRDADIPVLTALQGRILDAVWPRLAPGGMLLYGTCSLLAEENHEQMAAFLRRTPDARERPIEAAWGRACAHGRQVLTGEAGMDGFYFARLTKAGEPCAS